MAGVNKVILIGHVGRDAEVRYTQGGTAVANFSLATSETFNTEEGTGKGERTEWHNVVCWARKAEVAGEYIRKGMKLYVEGKLQTRDWVDTNGVKHFKTEIVCRDFQFLDKRGEQDNTQASQDEAMELSGSDEYDIGDLGPPLDMDK